MSAAAPAVAAPAATPALWVVGDDSPADMVVDLLSDLHLAPDTPATNAAFERYLACTPAHRVLLLGDIFEVWVGDDVLDDAASFESGLIARLAAAARLRPMGFMAGNRDFLVGARALAQAGLHRLDEPTLLHAWGQRLLLMHGDALCLDDRDYLAFRALVRDGAWQQQFLAQPLAARLAVARGLRNQSEARKQALGLDGYADLDRTALLDALQQHGARVLVHGHTHRPGQQTYDGGRERWVLSDWDLDDQHGPARAEVLRLSAHGLQRLSLAQACAPLVPSTRPDQ